MVALFCTRMKGGCFPFLICCFCSAMLHLAMWNLSDGDVISACISKDAFMKAPDESGINEDFTEKSTDWIATDGKRCTDVIVLQKIL